MSAYLSDLSCPDWASGSPQIGIATLVEAFNRVGRHCPSGGHSQLPASSESVRHDPLANAANGAPVQLHRDKAKIDGIG